jgi:hypothetical protein
MAKQIKYPHVAKKKAGEELGKKYRYKVPILITLDVRADSIFYAETWATEWLDELPKTSNISVGGYRFEGTKKVE